MWERMNIWNKRQTWNIKNNNIKKSEGKRKANFNQNDDVIHSKHRKKSRTHVTCIVACKLSYRCVVSDRSNYFTTIYSRECDLYAWLRELKERILSRDDLGRFHSFDYFEKLIIFIKDLYPMSTSIRRENRGQTRAQNEGKWQAFLFHTHIAYIGHARHSISEYLRVIVDGKRTKKDGRKRKKAARMR